MEEVISFIVGILLVAGAFVFISSLVSEVLELSTVYFNSRPIVNISEVPVLL